MKKFLPGSMCLFVCLYIVFCAHAVFAEKYLGEPRMVIKDSFFDAKDVKEGDIIEHTFRVVNTGDRTLHIRSVNPG